MVTKFEMLGIETKEWTGNAILTALWLAPAVAGFFLGYAIGIH